MPETYDPIASTTIVSPTNIINFTSIPSTYTDLQIIGYFGDSSNGGDCRMYFNGDTAANYNMTRWWGNGDGTVVAGQILFNSSNSGFWLSQNNANSSDFICSIVDINNYASTSMFKQAIIQNYQAGSSRAQTPTLIGGNWQSTSAINAIRLQCNAGNFPAGTSFTIYGITKA